MKTPTQIIVEDLRRDIDLLNTRIVNNNFKIRTYKLIPHKLKEFEGIDFILSTKKAELIRKLNVYNNIVEVELQHERIAKHKRFIASLPDYVKIPKCNLYLQLKLYNEEYFYGKHQSFWKTKFRKYKGELLTINLEHTHLHNLKLESVTYKEWCKEK